MNNQEIRAALERHWEATVALDLDRAHDIYHDDLIVEFPQSGERISGEHNCTNSGHTTPLKLLLRSCEHAEKEVCG